MKIALKLGPISKRHEISDLRDYKLSSSMKSLIQEIDITL